MSPSPGGATRTEARLRAALAARAALLTPYDLRPAAPPEGRVRGTRRVRGAVLAGLALAAAVVVLVLLPGDVTPSPAPPARPATDSAPPSPAPPPPATPTPAPATPSVSEPSP
ncbi:hypothetical protein ACIQJ4_14110 [Streptomyces filamentosus]|uniref:hypothetical protein n=1 Tax=Streptomyces filamentosus TaxID=67294 RepID=UPI0037FF0AE2